MIPLHCFAKPVGVLWLLTGLVLAAAIFLFLLRTPGWWMVAAVGIFLSQSLIFLYWQEARFGTLANVLLLLVTLVGFGQWKFHQMVESEKIPFVSAPQPPAAVMEPGQFSSLPTPVQKWLNRSQIVGKQRLYSAYLTQQGRLRTSAGGNWMPVQAEQYFTIDTPGFLWIANVEAAPLVHLAGRDKFYQGKGHMLIKLLSLYPVANAMGKEIDQGTLLRYMAEMVWFPSAALSPYLTWAPIDAR
ncbi:MAG: DUF6544 family protein, partial [Rufibacter sp.]